MRLTVSLLVGAGLLAVAARPAHACSICGCGDPMVDASEAAPTATPLRLAVDGEWLTATAAEDGMTEKMTEYVLRPTVVYSPTRRLNLTLQVPLLRKEMTMDMSMPGGDATQTGLGDLDVGARWFVLRRIDYGAQARSDLGVTAGTSLPTGPNDASADGTRLDEHVQLGSGGFGPYLGLTYAYHRDPWNLYASATARVHTANDHAYRYGAALLFAVRGDVHLVGTLAVELGVDGREALADRDGGAVVPSTGGLVLAASPGIVWSPIEDVWLRGRVQVPFYTDLDGDQTVGPDVLVSAQVLIH